MESDFSPVGIILVTSIILVYLYFKHAYTYWKSKNVPQLTPSFPFGDMASVIFRRQNMGNKIKEIYDEMKGRGHKYVGLYFFSRRAFLPLDPILIKKILAQDFQHFHDRGIYYDEKNDPISAHLFSLAGPKWKNLRARLTPAYSPGKLKFMFDTILNCGQQMVEILKEIADSDGKVEIKDILARYSTDVIGCCAFGIQCNSIRNPDAEFRIMGRRAFTQTIGDALKMIVIRSFPRLAKLLGFGVFPSTVTKFFHDVVNETIQYREKNGVTRNDFLQLLIQLKNKGRLENEGDEKDEAPPVGTSLTIDEAAAQAFIFFLAGFETTSTTISFALFEMARNETIRNNARIEINKILQKHGGKLTYDATMEMEYLDTIISETLRKYPPAPVFLRKCTETYRLPDTDVIIEEGLSVLIPAYGLHRDPQYFPNPENFDPDRFNEDNKTKIWDYTYIPFGDGPRICIGMRFAIIQIKIALALILKNFDIPLSKKTVLPMKMESSGIILAPIGGIWLKLIRLLQ